MKHWEFTSQTLNLAASQESQDRVLVRTSGDGVVVILSDGAGGFSGGAEAAKGVLAHFGAVELGCEQEAARQLSRVDMVLEASSESGDATGVVVVLAGERIFGASVGDSQAHFHTSGEVFELTEGQRRKPLLGSGAARPVPFSYPLQSGLLLVASDGLFNYAKYPAIVSRLSVEPFEDMGTDLADLARMPGGGLQDDLSLALIRCRCRCDSLSDGTCAAI